MAEITGLFKKNLVFKKYLITFVLKHAMFEPTCAPNGFLIQFSSNKVPLGW